MMLRLNRKQMKALGALIVAVAASALGIGGALDGGRTTAPVADHVAAADFLAKIPAYDGRLYAVIDATADNAYGTPGFSDAEIDLAENSPFESYSELDELGRCGAALACVGEETMPAGRRGDIRDVHPSGWHQNFYGFVDQEALYNRSHLIAHALSAEDANEKNLITGTRTMNYEAMRPFEEETAGYIERTGNHVLYRSAPIFKDDELVARGVHLEARSIEDDGRGLSFNIYCYNVEPGVEIDYATGRNWED